MNNFEHITFVSGNKTKVKEIQHLMPGIKILDIDLPEIQELDSTKIITAKLKAALEHTQGPIIVDDTSLYLDCFKGQLPGPLIKWFLNTVKNTGLVELTHTLGSSGAQAKTVIGYAKDRDSIAFFEGSFTGSIVPPQGTHGFGWDHVFMPDGHTTTLACMDTEAKNAISMRGQAIATLKEYLKQ